MFSPAFATPLPLRASFPARLAAVCATPAPAAAKARRRPTMAAPPARRVLVSIGTGSEEIETAAAVDVLRRAGADVVLASVEDSLDVRMSRGMCYRADVAIADAAGPFDAIALPGGMPGAERLRDCAPLADLLRAAKADGSIVAAVCASPAVVLATHGLLDGVRATCYPVPAFRDRVAKAGEGDVVVDGNVITGTGPGTSIKWALAVVEALYSKEKADQIGKELLAPRD